MKRLIPRGARWGLAVFVAISSDCVLCIFKVRGLYVLKSHIIFLCVTAFKVAVPHPILVFFQK